MYDDNLMTDTLICVDLRLEAQLAKDELCSVTRDLESKNKEKGLIKKSLGKLKRLSKNVRADHEIFVEEFVKLEGIKEIMILIEESQKQEEYDIVQVCCQILSNIFMYKCGFRAIQKKAKKYFEKFFELSDLNEQIKK